MRSYTLTPTRKPAGKALARRSRCALMSELLKDPANTKYLLRRIGILLRRELALMCSDQTNSILRSQSMSDLRNFTWNSLLSELSLKAPTLLSILQSCTYLSKPRQNRSAVIGMCSALLLKHRFSKNVHSAKSYISSFGFWRLQKIGIPDAHFIGFFFIHGCFTLGISAPTKSESKFVA